MKKVLALILIFSMLPCWGLLVCATEMNSIPTVKVIGEYTKRRFSAPDSYFDAQMEVMGYREVGDVRFQIFVSPDAELSDCKVSVSYDSEVLEYVGRGIVTYESKLFSEVTQESDGKLLISISRNYDTNNYYTDGFCFHVLITGDPQLQFEIVSYTDEKGQREDVQLVTDIPFAKVEFVDLYGDDLTLKQKIWVRLAKAAISFEDAKNSFFDRVKEFFADIFNVK